LLDYHLHTTYSEDSIILPDELCRLALAAGLKDIAITDHLDIDWPFKPYCFQIDDMDKYIATVKELQKAYDGKLTIRLGVEFGLCSHTLEKYREIAGKYPFDFIIGSIHIVDGLDPYMKEYYEHRSKEKSYTDYYETIYKLITVFDEFSVLGHLDYPRRYCVYPYDERDHLIGLDIIEEILKHLVHAGKGIEVNTSGYRHSSGQPLPHPDILKLYRSLGGEILTLGSDAHEPSYISYGSGRAIEMIKSCGFDYLTSFSKRQPSFIKL
jgi:histidinol-phosphatase (PHP family)